MIKFDSDYVEGCIPEILEALAASNEEQTSGYGIDPHCENARELIKKACRAGKADVHFVVGGTQANIIVLNSLLKPYQGALCADTGHINVHETGALEMTGHKCLTLPTENGKIKAEDVEKAIVTQRDDGAAEHIVQPGAVYISWPTELGSLYTKKEIQALSRVCRKYNVPLFCDGARLGYGLAAKNCDMKLTDFAKYCDVFYIGGTKVGALFGEAIVINNDAYKKNFRYYIKQHGAMLAKGRLLGIQFEQLFTGDRYLAISKHAMAMADMLADALKEKGYSFLAEPETNQLFPILSNRKIKELQKNFGFSLNGVIDKDHTAVRFVTSFMTKEENVRELIKAL
ncbi:MAG: low specificity L-threonine aldolase [Solobacterium sp.]|nr:low specificity L-threonine aldolase [Solobacterium sp.]